MMPMLIKRKLTDKEKETYAKPFSAEESRIPSFCPSKCLSQER